MQEGEGNVIEYINLKNGLNLQKNSQWQLLFSGWSCFCTLGKFCGWLFFRWVVVVMFLCEIPIELINKVESVKRVARSESG